MRSFVLLLCAAQFPATLEMGLGSGSPLYSPDDPIALLTNSTFQSTICGSSVAWLVEFYSSWCGHCIHFAPTFKELAADVEPWASVIKVAAIDCAQEQNMPTCREYEVMGYPSIKFFKPGTPAGDMGQERKQNRPKTVVAIKQDALDFLKSVQVEHPESAPPTWPPLIPLGVKGLDIKGLWREGVARSILFVEGNNSYLGSEVLMDITPTINTLNVPLALARIMKEEASSELLQKLKIKDDLNQALVTVTRDFATVEILDSSDSRDSWRKSIKNFLWSHSAELAISPNKASVLGEPVKEVKGVEGALAVVGARVASKKEVIQRRYKVFSSDLEKAVLYSISHEVAQHSSIAGEGLLALQHYVTVLKKYYPGRLEMITFLRDLHAWVHQHQDAVRGTDLSSWVSSYQGGLVASSLSSSPWQGCQGSQAQYGGYPCSLWHLFHTLTISQASRGQGEHREVLRAMLRYINNFFGCTECARHFDRALDGGKTIEQEVNSYDDQVLLLWRAHNMANRRLSGDISEDPVFPKLVFPTKEFCSGCYNENKGSNLWDEYNRPQVLEFLKSMYSEEKLSSQGIVVAEPHANNQAFAPETLVEDREGLDVSNYRKEVNSTSLIFFNGADLSLCFLLWGISAVLLFLIYLKFVGNKKFSNSSFFNGIKRKSSNLNPLLGKV